MDIKLSQPKGFEARVFLVNVKIIDPNITASKISFEVPFIKNWLFRKTENTEFYMAPYKDSDSPIRGIILDGAWECIVQSNGFSIGANPISKEVLINVLIKSIKSAIAPFENLTTSI